MEITFKVNLETVGHPTGTLQPSRTNLVGNETVTEADNFKDTRNVYIPGLLLQNYYGQGPKGYLKHGTEFTVTGLQAAYLKKTYVSSPAAPTDILQIVSQS
jgi:hypothetical protein